MLSLYSETGTKVNMSETKKATEKNKAEAVVTLKDGEQVYIHVIHLILKSGQKMSLVWDTTTAPVSQEVAKFMGVMGSLNSVKNPETTLMLKSAAPNTMPSFGVVLSEIAAFNYEIKAGTYSTKKPETEDKVAE